MSKLFYFRLACDNIRKNKSIYLPYLLAASMLAALYYILSSVAVMTAQSGAAGSGVMVELLQISAGIAAFLAVIILFYINSFVMKQRKKELGLYCILGMERRHLSVMMVWETAVSLVITLAAGILAGCLLSQLMFLLLMGIARLSVRLTFQIPLGSVADTCCLFSIGFGLVLFYDIIVICRTNPITLLRGSRQGEREPKTRRLLALTGVLAMAGGYGLALTCRTSAEAITAFFPAAILVIIGTYGLFTAGSIVMLKRMKASRRFYYKPENFIAVSGMMYRMKQNAAGLAGICVLSTAVLLIISACTSLVAGEEGTLREIYVREGEIAGTAGDGDVNTVRERAEAWALSCGAELVHELYYYDTSFVAVRTEAGWTMDTGTAGEVTAVECITAEDYSRITGETLALNPGEAAVWYSGALDGRELRIDGMSWQVREAAQAPSFLIPDSITDNMLLILPSRADLELVSEAFQRSRPELVSHVMFHYWYDLEGEEEETGTCFGTMPQALEGSGLSISSIRDIRASRRDFYQLYGTLFFVGISTALLFILVTVMIIYYKQITEGYDDRERFRIMEKVGMDRREVRQTVRRQVRLVFLLPLVTAFLHTAAAFPAVCKMLTVFGMTDTRLFAICTAGAALVFAVFYLAVYRMTAWVYPGWRNQDSR